MRRRTRSNGDVRVMPLGDSITEGTQVPGGYRIGLWRRMAAGGDTADFVGSQFNGPANLFTADGNGAHQQWQLVRVGRRPSLRRI